MSCGELTAVCQTWLAVGSGSDAEPAIKLVGVHAPCTVSDLPPDATALGAVFAEGSAIVWVQPTTGMSEESQALLVGCVALCVQAHARGLVSVWSPHTHVGLACRTWSDSPPTPPLSLPLSLTVSLVWLFSLIRRSHSISFTRAQGIP